MLTIKKKEEFTVDFWAERMRLKDESKYNR